LVRQNDAIILKRQQDETIKFLTFKLNYVKNDAIENFHHLKLFFLELAPFDLNLDGNFCDEIYKYILDVMSNSKKMVRIACSLLYIEKLVESESYKHL
jgi:hypothetical protein